MVAPISSPRIQKKGGIFLPFLSLIFVCLSTNRSKLYPVFTFQMKFQANDHQALKELADEIILFEGMQHPNLVRYYGVEVHRVRMGYLVYKKHVW